MPAPYLLIDCPPGRSMKDEHEAQALSMIVLHNCFIRAINSIAFHAPDVEPQNQKAFTFFCLVMADALHHHHETEETVYFPLIEKGLGIDAMSANVDQHKAFTPQLHDFECYLEDIDAGRAPFEGQEIVAKLNTFTEPLMDHLAAEIMTLEPEGLRKAFTAKQISEIEQNTAKSAIASNTLDGTLPFFLSCHDVVRDPWWISPVPWFIKLAIKYWFGRTHKKSWDLYSPCNFDGIPK